MEENETIQIANGSGESKREDRAAEKNAESSDEELFENGDTENNDQNADTDDAKRFRQTVLKLKGERAARAEKILNLVAGLCGADSCDYDGIENAVSQRNFEYCRRNDMDYRLGRWQEESERVKEMYPEFDLAHEMSDRRFFSLCYKGVGLAEAYLIVHKDELFTAAMEYAASELMRSGVFRKNDRVREGTLSAVSEIPKSEKRLSKSERRELIRRTERGERVVL